MQDQATEHWMFGEVSWVPRMFSLAASSHGRRHEGRSKDDEMLRDQQEQEAGTEL